jgi:hypothetical protein
MKWYWEPGDKVYHVYNPDVIGEVIRVEKENGGADAVLVKFSAVGQWFAAYWLRRAK